MAPEATKYVGYRKGWPPMAEINILPDAGTEHDQIHAVDINFYATLALAGS